jgi:hypothetical protein
MGMRFPAPECAAAKPVLVGGGWGRPRPPVATPARGANKARETASTTRRSRQILSNSVLKVSHECDSDLRIGASRLARVNATAMSVRVL